MSRDSEKNENFRTIQNAIDRFVIEKRMTLYSYLMKQII